MPVIRVLRSTSIERSMQQALTECDQQVVTGCTAYVDNGLEGRKIVGRRELPRARRHGSRPLSLTEERHAMRFLKAGSACLDGIDDVLKGTTSGVNDGHDDHDPRAAAGSDRQERRFWENGPKQRPARGAVRASNSKDRRQRSGQSRSCVLCVVRRSVGRSQRGPIERTRHQYVPQSHQRSDTVRRSVARCGTPFESFGVN